VDEKVTYICEIIIYELSTKYNAIAFEGQFDSLQQKEVSLYPMKPCQKQT
jgi:hypothetical protein